MKRTLNISLRATLGVAIALIMTFAMSRTTSAQEIFDVKVGSAADGRAGEYPLNYTINYENGLDQDVSVTTDGTYNYVSPAGAGQPEAITYLGQRYTVNVNLGKIYFQRNPQGGCWCLCLQWVRVHPWWWIPRWFWYYDPCC